MFENSVPPALHLLVFVLLLPVSDSVNMHHLLSICPRSCTQVCCWSKVLPWVSDNHSIDPVCNIKQDSEEDYEEDEDAGADDDGEYGDGDGDPCPNCGRKYRCRCDARAFAASMLHNSC